jgi:hypothetical protein
VSPNSCLHWLHSKYWTFYCWFPNLRPQGLSGKMWMLKMQRGSKWPSMNLINITYLMKTIPSLQTQDYFLKSMSDTYDKCKPLISTNCFTSYQNAAKYLQPALSATFYLCHTWPFYRLKNYYWDIEIIFFDIHSFAHLIIIHKVLSLYQMLVYILGIEEQLSPCLSIYLWF